ncbi:MAG TPA: hypothetical protein DCE65_08925 [Clostridiales bacterium]|nr:hypothetical protein [Clostridiales bacterium]
MRSAIAAQIFFVFILSFFLRRYCDVTLSDRKKNQTNRALKFPAHVSEKRRLPVYYSTFFCFCKNKTGNSFNLL